MGRFARGDCTRLPGIEARREANLLRCCFRAACNVVVTNGANLPDSLRQHVIDTAVTRITAGRVRNDFDITPGRTIVAQ